MILHEIFSSLSPRTSASPETQNHYDEKQDQTPASTVEPRKTRITLAQIKRLRIIQDLKKREREQDIKKMSLQYKSQESSSEF